MTILDFSLAELLSLECAADWAPGFGPRYNIAPTQRIPAVRAPQDSRGRTLELFRWGLVPSWAKDLSIGNRMINARSETVAEKPSFRTAFKKRRCLIPADGFYEWKKVDGGKQPYYIHMEDRRPFAFAGLWECWRPKEAKDPPETESVQTCTILTTTPNALMADLHDRMPVILRPDAFDTWLDPAFDDTGALQTLLQPYPAKDMTAYPVSRTVNNPRHDTPACVQPMDTV